jgi:hypothetical protein
MGMVDAVGGKKSQVRSVGGYDTFINAYALLGFGFLHFHNMHARQTLHFECQFVTSVFSHAFTVKRV